MQEMWQAETGGRCILWELYRLVVAREAARITVADSAANSTG